MPLTSSNVNAGDDILASQYNALRTDVQAIETRTATVGLLKDRPTPGTVSNRYYATDVGIALYDDGTQWLPTTMNTTSGAFWFDDCFGDPLKDWIVTLAASGSVDKDPTNSTDMGGINRLVTGSAAGGLVEISNFRTTLAPVTVTNSTAFLLVFRWKVQSAGTSTNIYVGAHSGYMKTDANDPDFFYGVRKAGTGNVFARTVSNGIADGSTDLAVAGTTTNTIFVEGIGGTGAQSIKYYLNTYNAAGLKATHTLSLGGPGTLAVGARISNSVSGIQTMVLDYALLARSRVAG